MSITRIPMTALPSSFGMPACGHASETTYGAAWAPATTGVLRVRRSVLTQGDVAFDAITKGTHAWRPALS